MFARRFPIAKMDFFSWLLLFSLVASGCSVNISPTPLATSSPQSATVPPTSIPNISPTQPNVMPTYSLPTAKISVTWGDLNLTGKLIYLKGALEDNTFTIDIQSLDLVTGVITT